MDDLANFEVKISWIPLVLLLFSNLILKNAYVAVVLEVLFWGIIIHTYFRVFSRNLNKRYEENQKFLNFRYNRSVNANKARRRREQMKTHCFFKCPMCKQEVRVPRGHGKIEISCPKCREKFIRRT